MLKNVVKVASRGVVAKSSSKVLANSMTKNITYIKPTTAPKFENAFTRFSSTVAATQPIAAKVQKPAPAFKADAVVDGQFKSISLDNYKGNNYLNLLAIEWLKCLVFF
jgi:hypothetical protein